MDNDQCVFDTLSIFYISVLETWFIKINERERGIYYWLCQNNSINIQNSDIQGDPEKGLHLVNRLYNHQCVPLTVFNVSVVAVEILIQLLFSKLHLLYLKMKKTSGVPDLLRVLIMQV